MPANSSAARCTLDPVPVEAKVSLPSSCFASAISSAIECAGTVRMHQHDIAARRDQADRREILARVVADVGIERRVDRKRARRDQKRVAVGRGLGDLARRDGAAGAAAVLDHDGLAEPRAHPLGDDARDHVVAAAGRVGHDQRDRARRIVGGAIRRAGAIRMTAASAARSMATVIAPWRRTSSRCRTTWSLPCRCRRRIPRASRRAARCRRRRASA